jgi:DNA adenine methylase
MASKNTLLKPVLKWVGGKRQLFDDILPLLPSAPKVYVEPFLGGAAVLLGMQPKHAIVNDYNAELINVYRVVRDEPDKLLDILREHSEKNTSEYYYKIRGLDRTEGFSALDPVVRAARIIYLNKTCFNGLYRVNSLGQINSPYGRYKNPNIINEVGIRALSRYLQGDIDIRCGDYADCLIDLPKGSFVYLDPPYMPLNTTSSFTGYTEGGFSYDEQVRLRDECLKLREQGIRFIQSNSDCPEIRSLYKDFEIKTVQAKRAINSKGSGRGAINEVLILGR